jgi:hypothetical protein
MTIAPPWTGLNAAQPPSAKAGRMVTPSSVARYGGAPSYRFIDLLPVDLLGAGGTAKYRQRANRKHVNSTHDDVLLG